MTKHDLIQAIEAFATERNLSPSTVTSRAVGNSRLYSRMKHGAGGCTIEVANRIMAYINASSPEARQ
jgi:hypothetical protein